MSRDGILNDSYTYLTISEQDFNNLLGNRDGKPFLVVFTAEWLGEGTIMDSIIEGFANDFKDSMSFYRIDVEESKNMAQRMGIRRLPAIYFFKNGELEAHFSGIVPARTLVQRIQQILE